MERPLEALRREREEKLRELKEKGKNPYYNTFSPTHSTSRIGEKFGSIQPGEETGKRVRVGGRIITRREHGKATFCDLQDGKGKIQIYARKDILKEDYPEFKKLDLGDIIGVEGEVFKTRTGELTIKVEKFVLLSKSLRPLPEKWHGLQDKELRYRKRYLDLMVNPKAREIFYLRSRIIQTMRKFLERGGFVEVETPMLQPLPGGAMASPFKTFHRALGESLYLRIAPELYLKRLVVGGMERVYELNRNFRNEGIDRTHNPEFTMLELYMAYGDYEKLMNLTEELVREVVREVKGGEVFEYQGHKIKVTPPWKRITFQKALKEIGGVEFSPQEEDLRRIAQEKGLEVGGLSPSQIMEDLLDKLVQPKLFEPTFIYDYPQETSPLAKRKKDEPSLVERFEVFMGGLEIGNAYSELNDPLEQKERLRKQAQERGGKIDEDFVEALEYGMPPTGGLGIGIDRLIMLLTDSSSIRDVILFPPMRKKESQA